MAEPLAIAAGTRDITPSEPCALQGFSSRHGPFSGIADQLELNAIRLSQGNRTVVIYSADVLYMGRHVVHDAEALVRHLDPPATTIVMAAASHTHFAPAVDASKPRLGLCDPNYVELFKRSLHTLLAELFDRPPSAATIAYRRGESNSSINRRRRGWNFSRRTVLRRQTIIAPNPDGYVDRAIRIIEAMDSSGAVVCVLWNFACHPSMFPLHRFVSADFPGVVRAAIRDHYNNASLPVIYLQGFSGDVSPRVYGRSARTIRGGIFRVLNGTVFGEINPDEFAAWSSALVQDVRRILRQAPRPLSAKLRCSETSLSLSDLIECGPLDRQLRLQRIALSEHLQMIGITAEVVAPYSTLIHRVIEPAELIPVGCVGDCFGYLPIDPMLAEGGYEVEGFFNGFSLSGRFRPLIQQKVIDAIDRLNAVNC
jgi:hypothetical protein